MAIALTIEALPLAPPQAAILLFLLGLFITYPDLYRQFRQQRRKAKYRYDAYLAGNAAARAKLKRWNRNIWIGIGIILVVIAAEATAPKVLDIPPWATRWMVPGTVVFIIAVLIVLAIQGLFEFRLHARSFFQDDEDE